MCPPKHSHLPGSHYYGWFYNHRLSAFLCHSIFPVTSFCHCTAKMIQKSVLIGPCLFKLVIFLVIFSLKNVGVKLCTSPGTRAIRVPVKVSFQVVQRGRGVAAKTKARRSTKPQHNPPGKHLIAANTKMKHE